MCVGVHASSVFAILAVAFLIAGSGPTFPQQGKTNKAAYESWIDECSDTRVYGWALLKKKAVNVDVFVNGQKTTTLRPNVTRPDVAKSMRGDARSGFDYKLTNVKSGDTIALKFPDGMDLANSPCKK